MSISDSSNGYWDDFHWGVYNVDDEFLFEPGFRQLLLGRFTIGCKMPRRECIPGVTFTNDVIYQLQITMDFTQNRWSATLDDQLLATNQPITTGSSALNLADIDAGWEVI